MPFTLTETAPENGAVVLRDNDDPAADPPPAEQQQDDEAAPQPEQPLAATRLQTDRARREQPNNGYTPVIYTADTPPAPLGELAPVMAQIPTLQQKNIADDLFNLMVQARTGKECLLQLNTGQVFTSALVAVPKTANVRAIYGLNFGTAPLGANSPIKNTIMALTGDGGTLLGHPEVIVLPATTVNLQRCLAPTKEKTEQDLTNSNGTVQKFLCKPNQTQSKEDIMEIAPFPTFLAYDALTRDIPAVEFYDRVVSSTHTSPMMTHLLAFLRSVMVGELRRQDNPPSVALEEWNQAIPREARAWKIDKCKALFPQVYATTAPPQVPQGPPPPLPSLNEKLMEQMLELMRLQMAQQPKQASFQEEKKEETGLQELTTKVSDMESTQMKIMCGQHPDSDMSALPQWYNDLFRKNQDKKDRDMIVAKALSARPRFEDYKIKTYPEMKKMIIERNWVGHEAGMIPRFAYACYGLTVFALQDFTDDEVADMTFDEHALDSATSTTAFEYKHAKKKLVATVPEDGPKWKAMILCFTNLLRNLFTLDSPMFAAMVELALLINDYPPEVLEKLPHHAKAAILWIIHLQARHYAQGHMYQGSPMGEFVHEFSYMVSLIKSGAMHQVSLAALPAGLLRPVSTKRKAEEGTTAGLGARLDELNRLEKRLKQMDYKKNPAGGDVGKEKEKRFDPWNEKLKATLEGPLRASHSPSLTQICTYCGLTRDDTLIPNASKRVCKSWMVLGKCNYQNCKLLHRTATDEQVTQILKKLDTFINAPDACPKGSMGIRKHMGPHAPTPLPQPKLVQVQQEPKQHTATKQTTQSLRNEVLPAAVHSQSKEEQRHSIQKAVEELEATPDQVKQKIGKKIQLMKPRTYALQHPAAPMLDQWAEEGCPVDCGDDWTLDMIETAIRRGAHISAKAPEAIKCIRVEQLEKIKSGYAKLIKWGTLKKKFPTCLKISPVAAIPHKSRSYRTILDLSFRIRYKKGRLPSVNGSTVLQAPAEAMVQLGNCIQRIIETMADNFDPDKPFAFAKLDIKDGF